LEPVFDAMLASAIRVCAGRSGMLAVFEDRGFRGVAAHEVGNEFTDTLSRLHHPLPGTGLDILQKTLQTIQIADCAAEPAYDPVRALNPAFATIRTALHVPMLKENQLLGAIITYRDQVLPFDDKEVELVESFAKQAVIAIENTRLITEICEALDQQTATAEMLEKAHSLCAITHGRLLLYDGGTFRAVATRGYSERFAEQVRRGFGGVDNPLTRPLLDGARFVHTPPDVAEIDHPIPAGGRRNWRSSYRPVCAAAQDDVLLGMIAAARREVRLFSDKEIALLENFAAQAVIAMENARLITETREA
jgi:GAF domain-containing protein